MKFDIDPEFRDLLPPLTEDEFRRLSIKTELEGPGKLTVARIGNKRFLIDGHNTHRICEEKGLKFEVVELVIPTRDMVIEWIVNNQLARRNLTDQARAYYIGKEYLQKKKSHGGDRKSEDAESSAHCAHLIGTTAEEIAEEHDVDPATVRRNAQYAEAVDTISEQEGPQAKAEILNGTSGETRQEVIARAKNPPIFCNKCQRLGVRQNCKECERVRKDAKENPPEPAESPAPETPTDAEGHPIPASCAEAFAAVEKFNYLDTLTRQLQSSMDELSRLPGGEQLRLCLKPTGTEGHTINKSEHLNTLKRDLRFTRPHSICPYCNGKAKAGCKGCSGLGWVSETTWKDTPDDVKARLK